MSQPSELFQKGQPWTFRTGTLSSEWFSGYQVHGTERKISHLLCILLDDLKLLGGNENDLENEIKIVK